MTTHLVSSGVTSTSITLGNNDVLYVFSGGTAIDTMVDSGGHEYVFTGGLVSGTTVFGGGSEYLYSASTAIGTTVDSGGLQYVYGSATASFTTLGGVDGSGVLLPGGTQVVSHGGNAVGTTVNGGGAEFVFSGGIAAGTSIGSGGIEMIYRSGTGTGTTVGNSGSETVSSGGLASGTIVNSGGMLVVAGGAVSGASIGGGGFELVSAGGNAFGTNVGGGAIETIGAGGVANGTIVDPGGLQRVEGGSSIGATINGDSNRGLQGEQDIGAGGIASFTMLGAATIENVTSGGLAVDTTLTNVASINVSAGGVTSGAIVSGAYTAENVLAGGLAVGSLLGAGGGLAVAAGGSAAGVDVMDGGGLQVNAGGVVTGLNTTSAADAVDAGTISLVAGDVVSAIAVAGGGVLNVVAGSIVGTAGVSNDGTINLLAGTAQSGLVIGGGGILVVNAGTTFGSSIVDTGQIAFVAGLSSSGITFSGRGELSLGSGASITSGTFSQFQDHVGAGAVASASLLVSGGSEFAFAGGVSVNATITGRCVASVASGGISIGATVSSGGFAAVSAGGTASSTMVDSGGSIQVSAGGQSIEAVVSNGGTVDVYSGGFASGTTIGSGGSQYIYAGSVASGTVVNGGGYMFVSRGTAIGTTITLGGADYVYAGGTDIGAIVDNFANECLSSGGVASATIVNSGGTQNVSAGGAAQSTTLDRAGTQFVLSGGAASGTAVEGGTQYVSSGGTAVSSIVDSGGRVVVNSGGIASDLAVNVGSALTYGLVSHATLNSGGIEIVAGGGTTDSTILNASSELALADGGTATGGITFSGGNADLAIAGMIMPATTISGFAATDTIDLTTIAFDSAGSATLAAATDILTVDEHGIDETFQLAGNYTGEYFHLGSDGFGGTRITVDGTPCYCRGTMILTDRGEISVEDLRIGDRLITMSGTPKPLRWIGQRSYSGRFAGGNRGVLPVLIRRDALADGVPLRDLFVSPLHAMFLAGVLIPARALVNGTSIVQAESVDQVTYFHLELEQHDVIVAEGAFSETFVDDGSRGMFQNAADYRVLYPDALDAPAIYCAPRVEDGEELEMARRRIARRCRAVPNRDVAPASGRLRGRLDVVSADRIEGWAQYENLPGEHVTLRFVHNGVAIGRVVANGFRPDLRESGIGDGSHGFSLTVADGLSTDIGHVVQVQDAADGSELPGSPWMLNPTPGACIMPCGEHNSPPTLVTAPAESPSPIVWRGNLDSVDRDRISGWAWISHSPDTPLAVQILDNGVLIARVLANRHRRDLEEFGIGCGRHSFELLVPGGLPPHLRHVIHVRVEDDGRDLPGSPKVIECAGSFDAALQRGVTRAIDALADGPERDDALAFVVAQTDKLLQRRAEAEGGTAARLARRQFRRRWADGHLSAQSGDGEVPEKPGDPGLRALVVDDLTPEPSRDAGSQVMLSHMSALQQLGYTVSFAASQEWVGRNPALAVLEQGGITCCREPYYASVEEVLRRQANCFDVIYLHRVSNASKYLAMARQYCPQARILYCVADLHHFRVARQAEVDERPELLPESRRLRLAECTAAWSADAVLTHSLYEAEALTRLVPGANVHVVPWTVPPGQTGFEFQKRHGIAFIGGYAHQPNVDAARFLVDTIMPLVWQKEPAITCALAGSEMPPAITSLAGPNVRCLGHVADLDEIFGRVRLTAAPLRYGAGVKGKVLTSLAAGIPCVMSPVAAEGLELPASLTGLIGKDAAALASLIVRLHGSATACRKLGKAGVSFIRTHYDEASVAAALKVAIGGGVGYALRKLTA